MRPADRERLLERLRDARSALRPALERSGAAAAAAGGRFAERLDAWCERGEVPADDRVAFAADRYALLLSGAALFEPDDPVGAVGDDGVFAAFPIDADGRRTLDEAAATLATDPATPPDEDLLGALYGESTATATRRSRGQFATPPRLARALVRWALPGDGGRVLDPAAGTGTFLLEARDRGTDGLVGVDVDPFALRLAERNLGGDATLHGGSFFDRDDLGEFDAVVGNPPYIRAEDLSPDAEHFRAHLPPTYRSGERRLSKRSDAYVYFVTRATQLLGEGGRLGMVVPSKWLASAYGEGFQRFLLDHHAIRGVVGFDPRAFDDALVDVCLLLLERRDDPAARADTGVRFVRLADLDAVDAAVDAIGAAAGTDGSPTVEEGSHGRTVALPQRAIEPGKLSPYLRAPADLLSLLEDPALVALGELADVSRGVMTGANRFFLLSPDDVAEWGIDGRFLAPALKSARGVETRTLGGDDVERSILDVHGYVEAAGATTAEGAKRALERDGHDGLLAYVRSAEAEGVHEGRTCAGRDVWFDLGVLAPPDAVLPKLVRERVFAIRNDAGAIPTNAVDCLHAREGVDPTVLVGILNSSLARAVMEVWGRDEAGMLQLMTYETASLPVPDVRAFDPGETAAVREAAAALFEGSGSVAALDAALLEGVEADIPADRVRALREQLLSRRVET